jgi:outer membrane protein assembly factor BamD
MLRKFAISLVLAASVFVAGCHHKVQNPIANIDSKQPDKVLFDRAMDAMKHGHYSVARTLLETLINTYPDSEYVARAKLTMGDAWYAEGGTAGLQQAEVQYKDFITFFPNMPEAAEAQLKVANIHYKQMEKPDRDFTQAMRAADEYKSLMQQFPDSKLVPEAKQRLREVQEVLAERQAYIAHFYYLRGNLAAAEARLTSLVDSYPLYSGIGDALYTLGDIYQKEADGVRRAKGLAETKKATLAAEYDQKAINAYSKIITRYPAVDQADLARKKLESMKAPVPKPTPEAIAQSQAEEDSRLDTTRFHSLINNFRKHPDVNKAAKTGEPSLEEEEIASAPAVVQQMQTQMKDAAVTDSGTQKIGVEGVKAGTGTPGASQAPPSSQPASEPGSGSATPTSSQPASQPGPGAATPPTTPSNELPTINNTAPAATSSQTARQPGATASTPPARVNEIGSGSEASASSTDKNAQNAKQQDSKDQSDSSSKKKKKKGLRKIVPF